MLAKRELLNAFWLATARGARWGQANPAEATKISQDFLPDQPKDEVAFQLETYAKNKHWVVDGLLERSFWDFTTAALQRHALLDKVPSFNDLVVNDFALAAREAGGRLSTFSVRFEEAGYDESPFARAVARHYGTDHHELTVPNRGFDPKLLETLIARTELTGRPVIGMSDCLWGLLDGINAAGLSMSLAFGGRRVTAPGFAMPLIVRYLLELCATTEHAVAVLARLPVSQP